MPVENDDSEIEFVNISKTFPGTRALQGVNLILRKGEVHALVGQNGSGKSTLIKILAGYYAPDEGGYVRVNGVDLEGGAAAAAHRLGLRFVHQGLGLIDQLDAIENVALGAGYVRRRSGGIAWAEERRRVRKLLDRMSVDIDLGMPVGELDAVERTAIAIARALVDADPSGGALVLDEPTVALSAREVERLFEIVRELRDGGVTIFYVSHYLQEVFAIADRISVLRGGQLVATERADSLTRAQLVKLMIGEDVDLSLEAYRSDPADIGGGEHVALSVKSLRGHELDGISFDLRRGEVLGFAGLQGSGIGEVAYALAGAQATTGEIFVNGHGLARRNPFVMREAGVLFVPSDRQREGAILPFLVRENLSLGQLQRLRRFGRVDKRVERKVVDQWVDELEISPPDGEREYTTLSGGNQQKVLLGKWLSMQPVVLLLDEPTNGVDVGARRKIYTTILTKAADGLAVVICSSDAAELAEISTRIIVLSRGRASAELNGHEITEANIIHEMAGDEA